MNRHEMKKRMDDGYMLVTKRADLAYSGKGDMAGKYVHQLANGRMIELGHGWNFDDWLYIRPVDEFASSESNGTAVGEFKKGIVVVKIKKADEDQKIKDFIKAALNTESAGTMDEFPDVKVTPFEQMHRKLLADKLGNLKVLWEFYLNATEVNKPLYAREIDLIFEDFA